MSSDILEKEKQTLTPESGFNLVGIDPFGSTGNKLYLIEHFERYQDALKAKKERDNPDEYLILYLGA
jgi:hypothetical protein